MSSPAATPPSQPTTIAQGGARRWIHAAATHGRFTRLRIVSSATLLALFYATPWLEVGGLPVLRLSFLDGAFVMFGQRILIYEFHHFVLLALLLVLTLFAASALLGRVWCGYACPQTIFVEQILGRIESLFEGPAATRIAAQGKPLTLARALRKLGKQVAFLAVSASFAFTLVALFTGPWTLLEAPSRGSMIALCTLTALAWFDGAYWREQFCHIVCPYGRFQSVMQDAATRTIGYDAARGEPRRRGKSRDGAGDCIDCGLCVRVCPSGIDIRQGAHQLECIGCAKCVDACDDVMKNVGKAPGLIRYDAVAMFTPEPPLRRPPMLRPRIIVYGAIWILLFSVGLFGFLTRDRFHVSLLSPRGAAPYVVSGGRLKNIVLLKVGNQSNEPLAFGLALTGAPGVAIESGTRFGPVAPGEEASFPVLISAPLEAAGVEVTLELTTAGIPDVKRLSRRLVGPTTPGGDASRERGDEDP
jgi:cytochrome c oxidase accessory protein FixG